MVDDHGARRRSGGMAKSAAIMEPVKVVGADQMQQREITEQDGDQFSFWPVTLKPFTKGPDGPPTAAPP